MKRFALFSLAILVLAALVLPLLAGPAAAVDRPLLSATRLSAALAVDRVQSQDKDGNTVEAGEWAVGPAFAYNLLASDPEGNPCVEGYKPSRPLLSLAASVEYGLESKVTTTRLGVRWIIFAGGN